MELFVVEERMDTVFHSRVDREIETLTERLHPARVCIDNNTCKDCTVVKVRYNSLIYLIPYVLFCSDLAKFKINHASYVYRHLIW